MENKKIPERNNGKTVQNFKNFDISHKKNISCCCQQRDNNRKYAVTNKKKSFQNSGDN